MFEMTRSESATASVNLASEDGLCDDSESRRDARRVILVVDSDQLTRLLFRFRLQETGFSVHSAKNGKDAITKLRQIRPDAVLLDLFLRDKSSIDLLREIRTQPDTRDVPVFALVPKQLTRVERKAAKWTLSKVFEKPYTRSKDIARAFLELFDRNSRPTSPLAGTAETPATTTDGGSTVSTPASPHAVPDQNRFARGIESQIAATRQELQFVAQRATLVEQQDAFSRLSNSVEMLTAAAREENLIALGLQSAALGGLTAALAANPAENNATVRKTLTQAVDLLYALSNPPASTVVANGETLSAVVIDDDQEARSEICSALEQAEFASLAFSNPTDALTHLEGTAADVIVLNAALVDQNGSELSGRIRELPRHGATPILFLTPPGDLETASQVTRNGSSDLATRPFLSSELALKALILSLKQRIETTLRAAYDVAPDPITPPAIPTAAPEQPTTGITTGPRPVSRSEPLIGPSASTRSFASAELQAESQPIALSNDSSARPDESSATLLVDDSWQLLAISPEGAALLGNPDQELVGRRLNEWVILGLPASPSHPSIEGNESHDSPREDLTGLVIRRGDGRVFTGHLLLERENNRSQWSCLLTIEAESVSMSTPPGQNPSDAPPVETSSPTEAALFPREPKTGSTELLRRVNDLLTIGSELPIQFVAPESPSDSETEVKQARPEDLDDESDSPALSTSVEPIDTGVAQAETTDCKPIVAAPANSLPIKTSPTSTVPTDVTRIGAEPASAPPTSTTPGLVTLTGDEPIGATSPDGECTGTNSVDADVMTGGRRPMEDASAARLTDGTPDFGSTPAEPIHSTDFDRIESHRDITPSAPTETLPQPQTGTPMQTKNEKQPEEGSRSSAPTKDKHETATTDHAATVECDQDSGALEEVNSVLNDELNQLRHQYATAKQSLAELEARLNDSMRSLANATAQAQREQSERRRFEHRAAALAARLEELHNELKNQLKNESESRSRIAELEQRLSKRAENEFQSRADLEQESSEKKALEDKLTAVTGMNDALRQQVSQLEKATDDFKNIQHDLESRLKASTTALELANERLKQESADRAKLQSELQKAKESVQSETRDYAVELARLRSAVQAETLQRRRAESEAVQARCGTVEAERASTAALTKFQQRVRTPVSSLMQDVGRLLESELAPEQRELAESILANAALVQTNLQDLSTSLAVRRKGIVVSSATPPALPHRGGTLAKTSAENVKQTSF